MLCKFLVVTVSRKQKPHVAWFELSVPKLGPSVKKVLSIFTNSTAIDKSKHPDCTVVFSLNILPLLFGLILAKALIFFIKYNP